MSNLEQTHTSLELSKWLKEKGFEKDTKAWWSNIVHDKGEEFGVETFRISKNFTFKECLSTKHDYFKILNTNGTYKDSETNKFWKKKWKRTRQYPAYDILNDLCVRYAKEIFGKEITNNVCSFYEAGSCHLDASDNALLQVGVLLRIGKKEKAEQYIMEHSIIKQSNND